MKVTKEQKVYLGLLAIGLVALTLDRLVFTPSSAEAADSSSDLLVTHSEPPTAPAAKSTASSTSNPVAQKLALLSESMHLAAAESRDAFTPSAAWVGKPAASTDTKSFEQTHQLSAVIVGRRAAAMVDGRLIAVGQTIDGYKLVSVIQGAATFQAGDVSVTLRSR
jgi:hypothetical protein